MSTLPTPISGPLQALLARIACGPQQASAAGNSASDYDWSRPSLYTAEQIGQIGHFGEGLAEDVARALAAMICAEVKLAAIPPQARYGTAVAEALAADGYSVALAMEGDAPCGYLFLARSAAAAWVARLLGGSVGGDAARELSALEDTLLADILKAVTESLSSLLKPFGRSVRMTAAAQRKAKLPEGAAIPECCELSFRMDGPTEGPVLSFFLSEPVLAPVAEGGSAKPKRPAEEARKSLLRHLESADIRCQAWLGTASASVSDLVGLEAGDVLVLDRRVGDVAVLFVQGKPVLAGTAARMEGHYALQIVRRT